VKILNRTRSASILTACLMTSKGKAQRAVTPPFGERAASIFATNERTNQILLQSLAPAVWNAKPPGNVRTIAAIFTHMHNVRSKWIRLSAPHLQIPPRLARGQSSLQEVRVALAESATRCEEMLKEALDGSLDRSPDGSLDQPGRIKAFLRDGWAKPWPPGPEMLCYMLAHEAHHRGQVCMLAHQLGSPLSAEVTSRMWNWEKLANSDSSPRAQE
jgi:uncharacterized damage-inducible protein DinB